MKLMKSLLVVSLALVGTSTFAAPSVKSITVGQDQDVEGLFRVWSSACVANLELKSDVDAQYRYGDDGAWQNVKIAQNTMVIFSQIFPTDVEPLKLSVKFLAKEGGAELTYTLDATETRLRQYNCDRVENYEFKATDAGAGSIDLVHVQ